MAEQFQLRDAFNPNVVRYIAGSVKNAWPAFDDRHFVKTVLMDLESLSFGDRSDLIERALSAQLPEDFPEAAKILVRALGPELGTPNLTGMDGFYAVPLGLYVRRHGLKHFEASMAAFYELTKRFSVEWDIRAFIIAYPEATLARLQDWVRDPNVHVRRLVSECTRPRIPLGCRLPAFQNDPAPVLRLLEQLKEDPELYVRRSVANNLNDIAKDNPAVVVTTLQRWASVDNADMQWLIRHAARTLLKQGNKGALKLLGYTVPPQVKLESLELSADTIRLGENLEFTGVLHAEGLHTQQLMIDFTIHFMKANGKTAPKVFKLSTKPIAPGDKLTFRKRHAFRDRSTRKHYAGRHDVEIMVNGDSLGTRAFTLVL